MSARFPADTDYVLIVHGTWNTPDDSAPRWYQLRPEALDNFSARLNAQLAARGMPGCVWRAGPNGPIEFTWSGNNDHQSRIDAADELFKVILTLVTDDPIARIHLVAHSHGGNVVLAAVERYLSHLEVSVDLFIQEYPGWYANDPKTLKALSDIIEWLGSHEQGGQHAPSHIVAPIFRRARGLLDDIRAQGREPDAKLFATRRMLIEEWFASPATNRLGRIVCMGTPFLTKRWWRQAAHGVATALRKMAMTALWAVPVIYTVALVVAIEAATSNEPVVMRIDIPGLFPSAVMVALFAGMVALMGAPPARKDSATRLAWVGDLSMWIGTLLMSAIGILMFVYVFGFLLQHTWARAPGHLNPVSWPVWLLVLANVTLAALVISALPALSMRDANLYFDEQRFRRYRPAARIPLLTIAAPHLDEAQLALSAEPLLRAQLLPRLREILYPPIRWWPRYAVVGVRGASPSVVGSRAIAALRQWTGNVFWLAARTVGKPVLAAIEGIVTGLVRQTLLAAATGVPGRELQNAEAQVSARSDLGQVFDETSWDVTPLLAGRSLFHGETSDAAARAELSERYSYLWDPAALRREEATSRLWPQVRATLEPYLPPDIRHDLLVRSITIERRIEEAVGLVDLTHSSYYGDPVIIDRIAEFLATGTLLRPD